MTIRNLTKNGALGAALVLATLAASAGGASAYVVCNRYHECWRVATRPAFPVAARVSLYSDDWRATHRTGYRWRGERDEHGYYDHGRWRRF